jgi:hypothetical protein
MRAATDYAIIRTYGSEYQGLVQYYLLAGDVFRLNRLRRGRGAVHAQDPGVQAPDDGTKGRGPIQGRNRYTPRATTVLPGHPRTRWQEATGRTVRRDPAETAEAGGPYRPSANPGRPPVQRADHPTPARQVRAVPSHGQDPGSPRPCTRRPRHPRTPTRVGGAHGATATHDPRGLPNLPGTHPHATADRTHAVVTGEPDAGTVRRGGPVTCWCKSSPGSCLFSQVARDAGRGSNPPS